MEPDAPTLFSTMNCCPVCCVSWAAKTRATWSTEPPGGNTAMIFTGLAGHACATAATGNAPSTAARAAARQPLDVMSVSSLCERDAAATLPQRPPAGATVAWQVAFGGEHVAHLV